MWPSALLKPNLNRLADELKQSLEQLPMRPCAYMDLTSCQLIVGAVVADNGSGTRNWFMDKLTGAARAMQSRGWSDPFSILEKGLRSDIDLMEWFRPLRSGF